ncbi:MULTISPECIES: hypothetical protein [Pseudonocardia]|uniref:Uncharacterized protein n=2 Tax=Pseudonocardia TaxID=1847 RepID=A0A1Y2MXY7_PSEAH|nr:MULTISPECIES: hypothetical protein [Pseudonocardia]OSY40055.1 hypothetical protein BG845_02878 [Pseudonocardia autotrophica]TDN73000.1 hypothetical protein C8E95_2071 [Pseudonocardia autotrophica]BBG03719.1 hypothetical protein Pdca_49280 [Pseudonocardia autotrophica]GEC28408.1 hypothetical protein PSA01_54370 [Pseudonocardia saturnea]
MNDTGTIAARALYETRNGGTAVLGSDSGARGVVQWICFGPQGYVFEVPDPAKHRPGWLRRSFGTLLGRADADPPGLDEGQVRGLEALGFSPGEHGLELQLRADELGHDQLVHLVVDALEAVGLDGEPLSCEVFDV